MRRIPGKSLSCNRGRGVLRANRASIVVICVWLLIGLSVLAVSVGKIAFSQINFSRFYIDREQSYYLSRAALSEAMLQRQADPTAAYDTLYELRDPREIPFQGNSVSYFLVDEESKININSANSDVLARLLDSNFTADEVIDYRKNAPFASIEELLQVDGIDQEDFEEIKELVTANSNKYININTAPREVLEALGCTRDSCDKILDYRRGYDGDEITADDNVFDSLARIAEVFEDLSIDCQQPGLLMTKSINYTLKAQPKIGAREGEATDVIFSGTKIQSWRSAPSQ
ncbi:general secretion pathway protein GspK [Candidatus Omnitrophota bacterium]